MYFAIAAVCSLIGLALAAVSIQQRRTSLAAWRWPTVPGIVRQSGVTRHPGGPSGHGSPTFAATVQYDYTVDGRLYHGHCIWTGMPEERARSHPDLLVLRYAEGNVAQVRHDPADPAHSVLEIHPQGAGLAAGMAGALLLVAGGLAASLLLLAAVGHLP